MPKIRAVDEMDASELRAELVSVLADGFLRYMQSDQFAINSRSITQIATKISNSRQLALSFQPNQCSL